MKTVYSKPVSQTFVATAYALKGKMRNGRRTHVGAVAADPRVLPIGSVIYIENMGMFTVEDTGGGIRGNRIDIYMPTKSACMRFGKRKVKVTKH